jgi:putative ABC transport system permease protein
MDTVIRDLKYALRLMFKSPGFTVVAVLTLALGIGANTAMFSVVTAVLLRPLPFPVPERIVAMGPRGKLSGQLNSSSYPDFFDYRQRARSFEHLASYYDSDQTLTGIGDPLHVRAVVVSSGFFEAIGVQPILGRSFRKEEEQPGQHVAMLSNQMWRERFSADPGIVGRGINLKGRPYTVVGVMPAGFQFPIGSTSSDLWMSMAKDAEGDLPGDTPMTTMRGGHFLNVVGRLKPGVSPEQAETEMSGHVESLAREYPDTDTGYSRAYVRPELETLVGDTRKPLYILLAAVGFVLLIACANIANLLLARSTGRTREIALRAALGATRARIVRQLVTESVLLAAAGAGLGLLLSSFGTSAMARLYPSNLPRLQEVGVDYRVTLFAIGIALASAILFGLVPALQVARPRLESALKEGGRSGTSGVHHARLRSVLVVAETALGVILLVGAGLLIRSFQRLQQVDPGFNPHGVLALNFDLPSIRYKNAGSERFNREFFERLRNQPGVKDAGGVMMLPLSGHNMTISFDIEGRNIPQRSQPSAEFFVATPHYFETMQVPVLRGRTFEDRDQRSSTKVVIVTKSFADKYFPGEDPVGKHLKPGAGDEPGEAPWREIIGVVGDIRNRSLDAPTRPAYYLPLSQLVWGEPTVLVRTAVDPSAILPEVRDILRQIDPEIPLYDVRTYDDYVALSVGREKFQTVLLGLFAGIALLLTAVGLYGVMAYSVVQRTQEIGIRLALGASHHDVLAMVLRGGATLAGIGLAVGTIGALILTRFMKTMLFGVKTQDPATFVVVCVGLSAVALLASYIPARRATKVDPMVALRYE